MSVNTINAAAATYRRNEFRKRHHHDRDGILGGLLGLFLGSQFGYSNGYDSPYGSYGFSGNPLGNIIGNIGNFGGNPFIGGNNVGFGIPQGLLGYGNHGCGIGGYI